MNDVTDRPTETHRPTGTDRPTDTDGPGTDRPGTDGPGTDRAAQVVEALTEARLLDSADRERARDVVTGVLAEQHPPAPLGGARGLPRLVEVVAYLGAALVLAAGALFLVQEWGSLRFGSRVALLAVVTLVLLGAGAATARVPADGPALDDPRHDVRRRLAGALLTFAALAAAFLAGHVVERLVGPGPENVYWPAVIGGLVGALLAAAGYRVARGAVAQVGLVAGLLTAVGNLASAVDGYEAEAVGISLLALGLAWLAGTERRWFREAMVARALGVAVALVGAQAPVVAGEHAWLGYLLTAAIVLGGVVAYLRVLAWPYLAAAVIGLTLVVPEAVSDWTEGSLGGVGAVLVTGVTLLLASFAGYRLRAEATD